MCVLCLQEYNAQFISPDGICIDCQTDFKDVLLDIIIGWRSFNVR